mmetsp:Transcript_22049/g.33078  ORF Transcript_22049/g.33078 Transcript_22049/m.33078 type:complete len:401 (-) Transcript_22049:241-1443(-)
MGHRVSIIAVVATMTAVQMQSSAAFQDSFCPSQCRRSEPSLDRNRLRTSCCFAANTRPSKRRSMELNALNKLLDSNVLPVLDSTKLQKIISPLSYNRKKRPLTATFSIPQPDTCYSERGPDDNLMELRETIATDVSTLRSLFGANRNKLWGDLDNESARKLYHSLLPRVLLKLYQTRDFDISPGELAPLAYEARVAAKEYARERCNVPGRIFAMAFDGIRHFKTYGKWSSKGMSWDEIWEKYELEIQEEIMSMHGLDPTLKVEDLTREVCLRILEKSCKTNDAIDKMFLKEDVQTTVSSTEVENDEIFLMAQQFDREITELISKSLDRRTSAKVMPRITRNRVSRVAVIYAKKTMRALKASDRRAGGEPGEGQRQAKHRDRSKIWQNREFATFGRQWRTV